MKRTLWYLTLFAAVAGTALAQTATPQNNGGKASAPAQQQGQQTGTPVPAKPHAPAAKTPEEFKAYQAVLAKPDGPSAEAAADDFVKQFPNSELLSPLYQHVMGLYQNANNNDKTLEMARKVLTIDPNCAPALATAATVLATSTRDTDLDRDERLAEAKKYAQKTIDEINAGTAVPIGTNPAQAPMVKDLLQSMAYAALGGVDFTNKDYAAAEKDFRKSVEPSQAPPDPVNYYQLALTLQRQGKYADALATAQQCVQASAQSPEVATVCKNLQTYLQKLVNNPPAAKPAAPAGAPAAGSPANPAAPQPSTEQPK